MNRRIFNTLSLCFALIITSTFTVSADNSDYKIEISRLGGSTRYETANAISDAVSSDYSGDVITNHSDTVIIASGTGFADALAGGPLGVALEAPILLSTPTGLDQSTVEQIKKLSPGAAYILGGEGAVPASVETQLTKLGIKETHITRLAGSSRFGTAVAIAEELKGLLGISGFDKIFVTYAFNYPDALSISPVAGATGSPILYAPADGKLDEETYAFIAKNKAAETTILGGPAVINEAVANNIEEAVGLTPKRLYGSNRYETSAKIFCKYDRMLNGDIFCFATGTNFPDALAGGVYAGLNSYPIILVDNARMNDPVSYVVRTYQPGDAIVFGGTGVVSDSTIYNAKYIPPLKGGVEVRYLGMCDNEFVTTEDEDSISTTVLGIDYKITNTGTNKCTMEVDVKWHLDSSTIPGETAVYLETSLYDNNNNVAATAASDIVLVKQGENFTTKLYFTDVPRQTMELFIGKPTLVPGKG